MPVSMNLRYAAGVSALIAAASLTGCASSQRSAHLTAATQPPLIGAGVYAGGSKSQPLPAAHIASDGVAFAAHTSEAPTGTAMRMLTVGHGQRITDPVSIRIAYAAQTWQGSRIHDSWADHTLSEPLTADAGTKYLTLYLGHATVGTTVELLLPPGAFQPAVKQDVLLVAQLTAGS